MKAMLLPVLLAASAFAQLPEFYKQVDRVVFVVPDLDKALAAWKPSGAVQIFGTQTAEFEAEYRGKSGQHSIRFAVGRFGDVLANWVEPASGNNAFSDFLKTHGPGMMSIMHRVGSLSELDAEVARMKRLGVGVLQRGPMGDDGSEYVMFDTEAAGKYVLAVSFQPTPAPPASPDTRKVTQFAFLVRDEKAVSAYWAKLGWPEMSVTHPELHGLTYRGTPGDFRARLGWQRHGKVVYEWVIPEKGPSTWHDHLEKHGEGLYHLAFDVEDMDRAVAEWTKAGYPYAMGGAWGEAGKRGSGRFAYVDTQSAGGIDVELLWNYRPGP